MSSPIISADEAVKKSKAIFIDARGGGDAYDRFLKGHLKKALYVDLDHDLSQKPKDPVYGGRHPLPDLNDFGRLLGKLGISPSSVVIVYDDKGGANAAARFWWMMKAIGHRSIQVVDGGLDALTSAGSRITTQMHTPIPTANYPVKEWQLPRVSIEAVEEPGNANKLVIDVREGYRYRGESEPIDLVAGHIPGALNVPFTENLTSSGTFRSPQELNEKFKKIIDDRNLDDVIVHCGSGVTACHTLLAMEYAGLPGSKLYVGSWSEWSRREKPITVDKS
jgi:thiosulfate/3-mercaptopyruvate sulfurtransferase